MKQRNINTNKKVVEAKGIKTTENIAPTITKIKTFLSPTKYPRYPDKRELNMPIGGPIAKIRLEVTSDKPLNRTIYVVMKVMIMIAPDCRNPIAIRNITKSLLRIDLADLTPVFSGRLIDLNLIRIRLKAQNKIGIVHMIYAKRQL